MIRREASIHDVQAALANSPNPAALVLELAESSLALANSNQGKNTYLWRDPAWTIAEARRMAQPPFAPSPKPSSNSRPESPPPPIQRKAPLWGIPISVKDCFDLAGSPTTCGTLFYRDLNGIASSDSWLVQRLRDAGAVITGKTHLHPLAYGITGENADFGDCLQPGNSTALTGGSSSGAAASVLEGSAIAAIGTDTGGSIRVPAALCGLAGYRASLGRGQWQGAAHLAPSFDTMGWLFRDLQDAPLLGSIFIDAKPSAIKPPTRFAIVDRAFLHDCEPAVLTALAHSKHELESLGLTSHHITVDWWSDSLEIFAAIQASEAAAIHHPYFSHFEPSIRERLEWGESLSAQELRKLRARHTTFRYRMDQLLAHHELLLLPAAPLIQLTAGADHSQTRTRLLRYTTPVSLAGMPAVTIPFTANGKPAGGAQLIAAREHDESLLALAASLRRHRAHPHEQDHDKSPYSERM